MKNVVLGLLVALSVSSCATLKAHDPFRNADGSINVPKVLEWIGYGLQADCLIPGAISQGICSVGTPALAAAQAAADRNPQAAASAAGQSLQNFLATLPPGRVGQAAPYFNWGIKLLKGLAG